MIKLRCKLKIEGRTCGVSFNKGGIMMACYHCKHQYTINDKGRKINRENLILTHIKGDNQMKLTQNEIRGLAENLANAYGAYYNDKNSAYPIHFFICENSDGYYVEDKFDGSPKNEVAYIGELRGAPELSATEMENESWAELVNDIENAEWD